MESVKPLAIPESLHSKLVAIANKRKPKMTLKALVIELLTAAIAK